MREGRFVEVVESVMLSVETRGIESLIISESMLRLSTTAVSLTDDEVVSGVIAPALSAHRISDMII